jgi:hypothetical protein
VCKRVGIAYGTSVGGRQRGIVATRASCNAAAQAVGGVLFITFLLNHQINRWRVVAS